MKKLIYTLLTLITFQSQASTYYCQNNNAELLIETPIGTTETYAVFALGEQFFEFMGTKTAHAYKKDGTLKEEFYLKDSQNQLESIILIETVTPGTTIIPKKTTDDLIIGDLNNCTRAGCDFPKHPIEPIKLAPAIDAYVHLGPLKADGTYLHSEMLSCESL